MNPRSALVADRAAVPSAPPATPEPVVVPTVPKAPPSAEQLAARHLVDQAKAQLMAGHGMAEPDAYRWIQKCAMDGRIRMAAVAAGILDGSVHPDPPTAPPAES